MQSRISYSLTYNVQNEPRIFPKGVRSLKSENQPYFDNYGRFGISNRFLLERDRNEVLKKLGYDLLALVSL